MTGQVLPGVHLLLHQGPCCSQVHHHGGQLEHMGSGRSEEQREQDAGLLLHLSKASCCGTPPEQPQQAPVQAAACSHVQHVYILGRWALHGSQHCATSNWPGPLV